MTTMHQRTAEVAAARNQLCHNEVWNDDRVAVATVRKASPEEQVKQELRWLLHTKEGLKFRHHHDDEGKRTMWHNNFSTLQRYKGGIYRQALPFVSALLDDTPEHELLQHEITRKTPWFYLLTSLSSTSCPFGDDHDAFKATAPSDAHQRPSQEALLVKRFLHKLGTKSLKIPVDKCGNLPLHIAANQEMSSSHASEEVIQILLEAYPEAASNCANSKGKLPIHYACSPTGAGRHNVNILKQLHAAHPYGLHQKQCNGIGYTPFGLLCQQRSSLTENKDIRMRQQSFERSLVFTLTASSVPSLSLLHEQHYLFSTIAREVVQQNYYFPPNVWRIMVETYPQGLFYRNTSSFLVVSPAAISIFFERQKHHQQGLSNNAMKLLRVAVDCILGKMEGSRCSSLTGLNSFLSMLLPSNEWTMSQMMAFFSMINVQYGVRAFASKLQYYYEIDRCHQSQKNNANEHEITKGPPDESLLHMFCYGLKCWKLSQGRKSRCLSTAKANQRELMRVVLQILGPQSCHQYNSNGLLPLHAMLLLDKGAKGHDELIFFELVQDLLTACPPTACMTTSITTLSSQRRASSLLSLSAQCSKNLFPFMMAAVATNAAAAEGVVDNDNNHLSRSPSVSSERLSSTYILLQCFLGSQPFYH